ncbi:hypothetical protein E5676_scaffold367G00080 [Cucumis melo var. makuwa]|uniref:Uncharacterized protein n=1 Tax=Cucumis melo var. makuwa TaxID=1194695 RepID=A0A5D3CGK9_CUCMM|nr:hypothetical protein E5676_scaffold367G00080 [Cucumis melo var. makuwa]
MKLVLVFLVCIAILAPSTTMAGTTAAAPSPSVPQNFPFLKCAPFILEATLCVTGVIKFPIAPHPSCCKAISKLKDCAPDIYQKIPSSDMNVIKKTCSL